MEKKISFRNVLSSVTIASLLTSILSVPTIIPLTAIVEQERDLVGVTGKCSLKEIIENVVKMDVSNGNRARLEVLIKRIGKLDKDNYFKITWIVLEPVYEEAKEMVADENATDQEISEIYNKLEKAFLQLELRPSKDLLSELINKAEVLDEENYTVESWLNLISALTDAKIIMSKSEATQTEVTNAEEKLGSAIRSLIIVDTPSANKIKLKELIEKIESMNKEDYIKATWEVMEGVYQEAKEIVADESAANQEIKDIQNKLAIAILKLRLKADRTILGELIKTAEELNKEDYTAETWIDLVAVLYEAKEVYTNDEATTEDIEKVENKLRAAIENLIKVEVSMVTLVELNEFAKKIEALDKADYSDITWIVLEPVYEEAKEMVADENATDQEISEIYGKLIRVFLQLRLKPSKDLLNGLIENNKVLNKEDYNVRIMIA